jgi:Ni,Fe-hydrogenase I large subunit
MNTQLKYQIQERLPQCRCVEEFGTDNNPYNERCSICDEGASGVADKVAKATQLCVEKTRRAFSDNWDLELNDFMKYLEKRHLEMISYLSANMDVLDWFERYDEQDDEIRLGYHFESMAMNLRLQKDSDQVEMLNEIIYRAVNELWILDEKERKEKEKEKENQPEKKRIIKKKVPTKI